MSAAQPNGIFHNPAPEEIRCTGDDKSQEWRSDVPLNAGPRERFASRDPNQDTFQPDPDGDGDPIIPEQAELDRAQPAHAGSRDAGRDLAREAKPPRDSHGEGRSQ
jgi:hypothetical protein